MQCKKIFDGRKLPWDAKEQLRLAVVRRVISGESPEAVAKGMGLNRRTVYRWLEAHYYGGEDALKSKPIPGAPPKISASQMEVLARIVREKSPLQLKFPYVLWTLAMILRAPERGIGWPFDASTRLQPPASALPGVAAKSSARRELAR
jgi:transposase